MVSIKVVNRVSRTMASKAHKKVLRGGSSSLKASSVIFSAAGSLRGNKYPGKHFQQTANTRMVTTFFQ